ncbi:aminoacyl-tRNA hydrolase [Deferribacter abyssi]|uniref:aminoacyl-tRNA hydrolase n=1 Tax=Deferribacter abyssi TaxID=213806 RepID=UPI003C1D9CDE
MIKNLIIGLGNPGKEYERTRHNIGFMVVNASAEYLDANFVRGFKGGYTKVGDVILFKPFTFMNRSGEAVREIVDYYKVDVGSILVIHDDLDMEFGKIKFKKGGSDGGHNGIKSIINCLKSRDFFRLKIGISKPIRPEYTSQYVLGEFNSNEKKVLPQLIELCRNAVLCFMNDGYKVAMNNYNNKKVDKEEKQCRK